MNIKKISCAFLTSLFLIGGISTKAKAKVSPQRIWGNNRYDTSISICQNGWHSNSDYAIIVSGQDFGDALSATPLAKKYNAPILLATKYKLDNQSKEAKGTLSEELLRLKVKKVFIIGGKGVISDQVENSINKKGIKVERIAGKDRYLTSLEITKKLNTNKGIVLATGENFKDALSISPIASAKGMPIMLVQKDKISAKVKNYIKDNNISKTYVLGDKNIISDEVVEQFPKCERILGENEYERNLNIINKFGKDVNFSTIYVASGVGFADTLSGSALASLTSSPIILLNNTECDKIQNFIDKKLDLINQVNVLGGKGVVKTSVLKKILPVSENSCLNSSLINATLNNQKVNSIENNTKMSINLNVSGLPKEAQIQVNKILPIVNSSKLIINTKANTNDDKTVANAQMDITINIGEIKVDTTAWVFTDISGNTPKIKEIIKIPEKLKTYLPEEFSKKQYMVIDLGDMSSQLEDEGFASADFNNFIDFSKKFQPKFTKFLQTYMEQWNPGINFITYKGLVPINTVEGKKYAQTYQIKLNDSQLKTALSYTVNNFVQNKDYLEFVKETLLSSIDLSGAPNKNEIKESIEKAFNKLESNPKESMNSFNSFMDKIKDIKILGDKGIDITYSICNGYIIAQNGVIDYQIDISKFDRLMKDLSGIQSEDSKEIKGLIKLAFNFTSENYNINKEVKINAPEVNEENSFGFEDIANIEK